MIKKLTAFLIFLLVIPTAKALSVSDYVQDFETTELTSFSNFTVISCSDLAGVYPDFWYVKNVNIFFAPKISRKFDNYLLFEFNHSFYTNSTYLGAGGNINAWVSETSYFLVGPKMEETVEVGGIRNVKYSFAIPYDTKKITAHLWVSVMVGSSSYDQPCDFEFVLYIPSQKKVYGNLISDGETVYGKDGLFRVLVYNNTFPNYPTNFTHCFTIKNLDPPLMVSGTDYGNKIELKAFDNLGNMYAYKTLTYTFPIKTINVCDNWLAGMEELAKNLTLKINVYSYSPNQSYAHYAYFSNNVWQYTKMFTTNTTVNVSAVLFPAPPGGLPPPTPPTLYPSGCNVCDYSNLNPNDPIQYLWIFPCLVINLLSCNHLLFMLVIIFLLFLSVIATLRKISGPS